MIIGSSVSASEIARDIQSYVDSFSISIRAHVRSLIISRVQITEIQLQKSDPNDISFPPSILRLPKNITRLPEIKTFSAFESLRHTNLSDATITLVNGTVVGGFDEVTDISLVYDPPNEGLMTYLGD